mgnify:CR=1 FL=1
MCHFQKVKLVYSAPMMVFIEERKQTRGKSLIVACQWEDITLDLMQCKLYLWYMKCTIWIPTKEVSMFENLPTLLWCSVHGRKSVELQVYGKLKDRSKIRSEGNVMEWASNDVGSRTPRGVHPHLGPHVPSPRDACLKDINITTPNNPRSLVRARCPAHVTHPCIYFHDNAIFETWLTKITHYLLVVVHILGPKRRWEFWSHMKLSK